AARRSRGALRTRTRHKRAASSPERGREPKRGEPAEPAWKSTTVAANILQDLTLQKSLAGNEVGNLARQRLKRLSDEIGELNKQRLRIELEILNAQKGQLTQDIASEQQTKDNVQQPRPITGDDEAGFWPFSGEYWKDELGYYRVRIASQCRR